MLDAERAQHCQVLERLWHRPIVSSDDKQEHVDSAGAGDHRPHEALMTRDVDEAEAAAAEVEVGEPQLDRHPAPLLLHESVGVVSGERLHQRRLAMVDVAGSADRER